MLLSPVYALWTLSRSTFEYYSCFLWVLLTGCNIESCRVLAYDTHALVHVYSLALTLRLWDVPHYRAPTFAHDLRANLKNVAIPGTGARGVERGGVRHTSPPPAHWLLQSHARAHVWARLCTHLHMHAHTLTSCPTLHARVKNVMNCFATPPSRLAHWPAPGVPLSVFCSSKAAALLFFLVVNPLASAFGALYLAATGSAASCFGDEADGAGLHGVAGATAGYGGRGAGLHAQYAKQAAAAKAAPASGGILRVAALYRELLLAPSHWLATWRLNCALVAWHAAVAGSPRDYSLEDKARFLREADTLGLPVAPYIKAPRVFIKHRAVEGGQVRELSRGGAAWARHLARQVNPVPEASTVCYTQRSAAGTDVRLSPDGSPAPRPPQAIHVYKNFTGGGDWIVQEALDNAPCLARMLPQGAPLSTFRCAHTMHTQAVTAAACKHVVGAPAWLLLLSPAPQPCLQGAHCVSGMAGGPRGAAQERLRAQRPGSGWVACSSRSRHAAAAAAAAKAAAGVLTCTAAGATAPLPAAATATTAAAAVANAALAAGAAAAAAAAAGGRRADYGGAQPEPNAATALLAQPQPRHPHAPGGPLEPRRWRSPQQQEPAAACQHRRQSARGHASAARGQR